ncbi:MAG: hypothetical protein KGZ79_02065 [Dethiobacter sp.]|jgi:hypothetical protein|nr:hypothetical protein [Dethiobacter sp.]
MKIRKLVVTVTMVATLMAFGGSAFAASMVSNMATQKGGTQVARCVQKMERGVSTCATATQACE